MNLLKYFKFFGVISFLVFGLFFTGSSVLALAQCNCTLGVPGGPGREVTVSGTDPDCEESPRLCDTICGDEINPATAGELVREARCIISRDVAPESHCRCHGFRGDDDASYSWTVVGETCLEDTVCPDQCEESVEPEVTIDNETAPTCISIGGSESPSATPPTEETKTETGGTRAAPSRDCDIVNHDCMSRFSSQRHIFFSNDECYCCGECSLDDFTNILLGGADYLFGILGALALLFFIYGGVTWLTAGGSAERVEKGKKILIGAVIGIAIAVGAWFLIDLLQQAIGVKGQFRL